MWSGNHFQLSMSYDLWTPKSIGVILDSWRVCVLIFMKIREKGKQLLSGNQFQLSMSCDLDLWTPKSIRVILDIDVALARLRVVVMSRCRVVAISRFRNVSLSRYRVVALARCRDVALSRCRDVALSTTRQREMAQISHHYFTIDSSQRALHFFLLNIEWQIDELSIIINRSGMCKNFK